MKNETNNPSVPDTDVNHENNTGDVDVARLASMIGLCRRAGRLGCGTDIVTGALKTGGVHLVLLAKDPSARTRKVVTDKCAFRNVTLIEIPLTREQLGAACGKSPLSAVCVTDPNFASAITALAGRR
ncbi:MAG: ribosomal L7Ae/L30e/S12e/Gadd45 family protein [Clostridia bacterium]|nr:ribosomal L7Ae/L30e/S12e/Gadd45 family protein [Clostridia bacterium]